MAAQLRLAGADPVGQARELLQGAGRVIRRERDIDYGRQFRLADGSCVNVYRTTGAVVPQGQDEDALRRLFGLAIANERRVRAGREPFADLPPPLQVEQPGAMKAAEPKPPAAPYSGNCPF